MTRRIASNELQTMWKDEAVVEFEVPLSGFCIKYWKTPQKILRLRPPQVSCQTVELLILMLTLGVMLIRVILILMLTLGVMPIRVVLILMLAQSIMPIKSSATNTYAHPKYHTNKEKCYQYLCSPQVIRPINSSDTNTYVHSRYHTNKEQ